MYNFVFQLDTTKSNLTEEIGNGEKIIKGKISSAETEIKAKVDGAVGDSKQKILDRIQAAQDHITGHFFDGEAPSSSSSSSSTESNPAPGKLYKKYV